MVCGGGPVESVVPLEALQDACLENCIHSQQQQQQQQQ